LGSSGKLHKATYGDFMQFAIIFFGIIAAAILGTLVDWLLKGILDVKPTIRSVVIIVFACVAFASIASFSQIFSENKIVSLIEARATSTTEPHNINNITPEPLSMSTDWVLFSKGSMGGRNNIFMVNLTDRAEVQLTQGESDDVDPAWSFDRKYIVFSSDRKPHHGNFQIYIMDSNGDNQRQITSSSGDNTEASWSVANQEIVFSSNRSGIWQIHKMNKDGSGQVALTDTAESNNYPTWSPDGKKIAFSSLRDGHWEIYIMNSDGTEQQRITDSSQGIYRINCDGSPSSESETSPAHSKNPSWSGDGTVIIFQGGYDNGFQFCQNWDIFAISPDGTNIRRIYMFDTDEAEPSWSEKDDMFAFKSATLNNGYDIFIRNIDGSYQNKLIENKDYYTVIQGINWSR
jgi:Tol biopolymer transport system component